MKKIITIGTVIALSVVANGTVTLQFSTIGDALTNIADNAGSTANGLTWGVLVDADGDGFDSMDVDNPYDLGSSFALADGAFGSTDNVLFISPATTTTTVGAEAGVGGITTYTGLTLSGTVGSGDSFALMWFDRGISNGTTLTNDGTQYYGFLTDATFVLPPDGNTTNYSAIFDGADAVRSANIQMGVPEPSVSLLAGLGLLGLLRRRR